jgi:predicted RNA-binding Zn ribbon-like protein
MVQPGGRAPAPPELAVAQDLANTIDFEMGRDALLTPAQLEDFARRHGLGVTCGRADLERCREFREALRDVCSAHAGLDAPATSVATVNAVLAAAPIVVATDAQGNAEFVPAAGLRGADALLAAVAAGIARAVAAGTWPRLKACHSETCRWVYYDRSPAGRSRWCSMAVCGSRAKMRAYRRRRS